MLTNEKVAESDIAAQARFAAAQVARGAQTGAKNASDGFNRFVEGGGAGGSGTRDAPLDASKKDFWDSFAEAGTARTNASVGTSAIKKAGGSGVGGKKEGDEWDKW